MPPEILRYFIVRSRPENKLFFDPGQGLYNLIDEFAAAGTDENHPFRDAYNFAVSGKAHQVISTIPFKHLVAVFQAARGNEGSVIEILQRTGYQEEIKQQPDVIKNELEYVKNWLAKYAPEEVKFEIQAKLPTAALTNDQKKFLTALSAQIEAEKDQIDGQKMHELIYAAKDKTEIQPAEAFKAIYRVLLGKDYGPKAGWFLASLEPVWLLKRLRLQV